MHKIIFKQLSMILACNWNKDHIYKTKTSSSDSCRTTCSNFLPSNYIWINSQAYGWSLDRSTILRRFNTVLVISKLEDRRHQSLISWWQFQAKSRKYRGMFKANSPEKNTSSGKGLVSRSRTYASTKWDGNRCPEEWASPVSMPHPSQVLYGHLS